MTKQTCPKCQGPVTPYPSCHTWSRTRDDGTEQWMACMPCDSATMWYCFGDDEDDSDDGCGWQWKEGLNPANPRSAENDLNDPHWEW